MLLMTINFAETREEIPVFRGRGRRHEVGKWEEACVGEGGGANGCLPLAEGGMRGRRNS